MASGHGLPPLFFETIYKEKVWGGRALKIKLNKAIPGGTVIGESWELSAVPGDESRAKSGPYAGKELSFIFKEERESLVGNGRFHLFPLLYKFIDSNEKLSIQVHPGSREAGNGPSEGFVKTECWFVVDAKPDAQLICGFRKDVNLHDIEDAVKTDRLPALCNFVSIKPGDVVFVPAGTVHALLEGVLIYEVQQTSDMTFRLYDWGRTDVVGVSRPLHVKESLQVVDTNFHDRHVIPPVETATEKGMYHAVRVACRYFALEEYRGEESAQFVLGPKNSFQVLTMLNGSIATTQSRAIKKGETVLLPASIGPLPITLKTPAHFLVSYVPDIKADVIEPLLSQGVSNEAIAALGGNPFHNDVIAAMR